MSRGYIIAWDSLVALSFVFIIMVGFLGLEHSRMESRGKSNFERINIVAENSLDTVNKMGALEEIGHYWATENASLAANLTKKYFDHLIPESMGYRLEAVDSDGIHVIYESGNSTHTFTKRPSESDSSDSSRAFRLLSGYMQSSPRSGWTARAWLEENLRWTDTRVSNNTECCQGWESLIINYSRIWPDEDGNVFYIMVPGNGSLNHASFNVSWEKIDMTTSSTTTTTSTTTTSTTLGDCNACRPNPDCEIPGSYKTGGDNYNYHNFTIPDSAMPTGCRINVSIYSATVWPTDPPIIVNPYDLYVNWPPSEMCQRPESDPQLAEWNCSTYGDLSLEVTCQSPGHLEAGEYYVMVDCWDPAQAYDLCEEEYLIFIKSPDPGCPNYEEPLPTTSTTTTTTTTATTTPPDAGEFGMPCLTDSDCGSGNCAIDYDGYGSWCAPAGNCVHQNDPDDMIAEYRLDGDANDELGSYSGAANNILWVFGRAGQAAGFDPDTQSYISTSPNFVLSNKTVSFWVKTEDAQSMIIGQAAAADKWGVYVDSAGRIGYHDWGAGITLSGSTAVNDDSWHHIAVRVSAQPQRTSIYVDGSLEAQTDAAPSGPATGDIHMGSCELVAGGADCDSLGIINHYFKGSLDEVRIFERSLQDDEVPMLGHCDVVCHGYSGGDYGADCYSTYEVWVCGKDYESEWSDSFCPICYGGDQKDIRCAGTFECRGGEPNAICDESNCSTDGIDCDFCGSNTPGAAGSDTWNSGVCDVGVCGVQQTFDCPFCQSCQIVSWQGGCHPTDGINFYGQDREDTVGPETCVDDHWCDGAGNCVQKPIMECSSRPKAIIFEEGVCKEPESQTCDTYEDCHSDGGFICDDGICRERNCDDDGSDGDRTRLSYRSYTTTQTYAQTYHDESMGWDRLFQGYWQYSEKDDDDISIGTSNYAKHGESFMFEADIADTSLLEFTFNVMPEANCPIRINLEDDEGNPLGDCEVGSSCSAPLDMMISKWAHCTISIDDFTNIERGQSNTFRVHWTNLAGGSSCGFNMPCVLFFDRIHIECV